MENATRPCTPNPATEHASALPASAVPLAAADADLTGRTLGEFHILRKLGGGGMGDVYLAEQTSLKRQVALKILRRDLVASQPEAMERFRLEAQAVARATHANIVQIYAIGEAEGIWYMALEYVEGRNLKEYIARKGPPEILTALSIMRQVAAALQRAGELGIVHRDIKPENILLTRKGEAKVADFGLSRCLAGDVPLNLTQSGMTMGTPLYMSPEQVESKPLDPRTDIYSFGVTCYHMLTGHPPFKGESPFEVALKHVRQEPEPLAAVRPDLPEALCAMVHRMMAKDPAARYQTARELLRDIARVRESLSGSTALVQPLSLSLDSIPSLPEPPATVVTGAGSVPEVQPLLPTQRMATGSVTAPRPSAWRTWRPVLIAASILVALTLGIAFGALRHYTAAPAHAALVPSPDEINPEPGKNEPTRPDAPRHPLIGSGKKPKWQAPPTFAKALQDGLNSLDKRDFPAAAEHFQQLDNVTHVPELHALGHLGMAVVHGLRGEPKLSAEMFRTVAQLCRDTKECRVVIAAWKEKDTQGWLKKVVERNQGKGYQPLPLFKQ
jgi:serine/threonine-protein kinase